MNPVAYSLTGTGIGRPVLMDWNENPFMVAGVVVVTGSIVDAKVQYTFDDILNPAVTPTWLNHPAFTAATAVTTPFSFGQAGVANPAVGPVRAIRLNMVDGTGGGTAAITIMQATSAP